MEEFDIPDAPDFQIWLDGKRVEISPKVHRVLSNKIVLAKQRGDLGMVEELALCLQQVDDLDEVGVRSIIELHAMAGDRVSALRVYGRWAQRLRDDVGAAPSKGLEELVDRIRKGEIRNNRIMEQRSNGTLPHCQPTIFGRESELELCSNSLSNIQHNQSSHLLLRGDVGSGKTALLDQISSVSSIDGIHAVRVRCYAPERALPFAAIADATRQLFELPGAIGTDPHFLDCLACIAPSIRRRAPATGELQRSLSTGSPENSRILFTEAFIGLLVAVSEVSPVVILVDDVHFADEASTAVLHLVMRRLENARVSFICTTASTDLGGGSLWGSFKSAPTRQCACIELGPLSQEQSNLVLQAILSQETVEAGPALIHAILEMAAGNPMAIELLAKDWINRGQACFALLFGGMTQAVATQPEESLRYILEGTTPSFDGDLRSIGEMAAILGHRLNELSFYQLLDIPRPRVLSALTQLSRLGVLRDIAGNLEFASELVRSQIYFSTPHVTRCMLHGLVVDTILACDLPIPSTSHLDIAWHLVRANRADEASPWILSGGATAVEHGAPLEADLAISTSLPQFSGDEMHAAYFILAEAKQELGLWHDSLAILDGLNENMSPTVAHRRDTLQTVARRWAGYLATPMLDESTDLLLRAIESDLHPETRVKAAASVPYLLTQSRDPERYRRMRSSIYTLDMDSLTAYQRLHILVADGWLCNEEGDPETARARLSECLHIIDKEVYGSSIALRALIGAGTLELIAGEYGNSLAPMSKAANMAKRSHNTLQYGIAAASLATSYGRMGSHADQATWARESLTCFRPDDWTIAALSSHYELAMSLVFQEQYQEARELVPGLLDRTTRPNCPAWAVQVCGLLAADILALTGNPAQALAEAERGTTGAHEALALVDFLGPWARWTALGAAGDRAPSALARLHALTADLPRYHTNDQAELLAAIACLEHRVHGRVPWELGRAAAGRVASLPCTVHALLRRTGLLDWNQPPAAPRRPGRPARFSA